MKVPYAHTYSSVKTCGWKELNAFKSSDTSRFNFCETMTQVYVFVHDYLYFRQNMYYRNTAIIRGLSEVG